MNSIAKVRRLHDAHRPDLDNTTVISGDVVEQVRRLKDEDGGDILQYGFVWSPGCCSTTASWTSCGLAAPVLSGSATPSDLLYRDATQRRFDLIDTEVHSTGMIILTYRPQVCDHRRPARRGMRGALSLGLLS